MDIEFNKLLQMNAFEPTSATIHRHGRKFDSSLGLTRHIKGGHAASLPEEGHKLPHSPPFPDLGLWAYNMYS